MLTLGAGSVGSVGPACSGMRRIGHDHQHRRRHASIEPTGLRTVAQIYTASAGDYYELDPRTSVES